MAWNLESLRFITLEWASLSTEGAGLWAQNGQNDADSIEKSSVQLVAICSFISTKSYSYTGPKTTAQMTLKVQDREIMDRASASREKMHSH